MAGDSARRRSARGTDRPLWTILRATTRTGSRPLGWDGRPPNRRVISLHALTKPHWDWPVLSSTSSAVADEQLGVPELGFRHHELPVPAGRMAALTGTYGA